MANSDRKRQKLEPQRRPSHDSLVSLNIFTDIWPQNLCGRYIQNKFGAAAEWNKNPRTSLMIYSERLLRRRRDFTHRRHNNCSVDKKVHTHFHSGWPHDPRKAPSPRKLPDWRDGTLNTHRQVCAGGVWESLPVWWQWWEIANTTGLMYSFQGQAFSPTRLVWWISLCAARRSVRRPIRMPTQLPRGYCGWIPQWPLWHFRISHDGW